MIEQGIIQNELDYERAMIAERKLRLLSKEVPNYIPERKKLRDLIEAYEKKHWSSDAEVSEEVIRESDLAEKIAETERQFIERRKALIRHKIKDIDLSQQELGVILGHHNKSYISELMNGISPFSLRDLIIINRLLKIDMDDLIPPFLSHSDRENIKISIAKLKNPKLKLIKDDFVFA